MTKFICIGGKAQHGKDTSATFLKEALEKRGYRVLITHYADLLKFICRHYFGWNGEKDDFGRTLLQKVGTEGVRSKQPDYWVDFVINIIDLFPTEWDYVIIPDTRFPNEINKIKRHGYEAIYIKICRPGYANTLSPEQRKHPSETALDKIKPDIVIQNRTLESLKSDVESLSGVVIEWDVLQGIGEQLTFFDRSDA